ncbi:Holliday junction branch migration protein RuvA [Zunongwangia sp.]|uniref:Holliday junction branch migration protein RuvA n=1 Tax=Zunongwangia sp. TaxID=1965325 RepID=UPI003AA8BCCE
MIHHLKGKLVEKKPTFIVVECNGVGYFVHISLHTFSQIKDEEAVFVYTHLQVREDAQTLFGFKEKSEREIFRLLISVNGIGASIARTMLSSLDPIQIRDAIATSDVQTIQSIKGIGAKTAQRVILDLKDKIIKIFDIDDVSSITQDNTVKEETLAALETLGYARKQSGKVLDKILKDTEDPTVEILIKLALKKL